MENITKSFKLGNQDVTIVKGVSLVIHKGEFVSIMGPSGSGKSTLSSIIGCLARPSSGTYKILDHDVTKINSTSLAKIRNQRIGFIFQDFSLLDGLTAVENVMLPLFYSGWVDSKARARALECLDSVELSHRANHRPFQLSGGQKQRVAIARALANNPEFIFADEPCGALDQKTGHGIMALMQKLNMHGHTIVQVTHSQEHCRYGKRVLMIVDGFIIRDYMVNNPIYADLVEEASKGQNFSRYIWNIAKGVELKEENLKAALDLFEQCLKNNWDLVESIEPLSKCKYEDVKESFEKLKKSDRWNVRAEIIRFTKAFGVNILKEFCLWGLKDENSWVRFSAMKEIAFMNADCFSDSEKEHIVSFLKDSDERIRATVISILNNWKNDKYLPAALEILKDEDGRVRANAVEFIGARQFITQEIADILKPMLSDTVNRVRANAAALLHKHYPEEGKKTAIEMLKSDSNLERASGAWALRFYDTPEIFELLTERLRAEQDATAISQITSTMQVLINRNNTFAGFARKVIEAT